MPPVGARDRKRSSRGQELQLDGFEHNQWTFEGEIERLGAFSRGASHATGWRRTAALVVVVAMLAPIAISLVAILLR